MQFQLLNNYSIYNSVIYVFWTTTYIPISSQFSISLLLTEKSRIKGQSELKKPREVSDLSSFMKDHIAG